VQREEAIQARKDLAEIAQEPFARSIDDSKLESMRKQTLRDGDPMAQFFAAKQREEEMKRAKKDVSTGKIIKNSRPVYSGPTAPPNRFSIKPGYRWDGVNRGNGFEKELLTRKSMRSSNKEEEYKWSVAEL
jgi:pre-mRNA-splicing factor CWC26